MVQTRCPGHAIHHLPYPRTEMEQICMPCPHNGKLVWHLYSSEGG